MSLGITWPKVLKKAPGSVPGRTIPGSARCLRASAPGHSLTLMAEEGPRVGSRPNHPRFGQVPACIGA